MNDQSRVTPARHLPGEVGLWIFILADLFLFGLYFSLFVHDRSVDLSSFKSGQVALNRGLGLVYTILLLTGSWAVVMGLRVEREPVRASRYLAGAGYTGVLFLLLKGVEYFHLIRAGHGLAESRFFTWYFFLTAYHALHVLAGTVFLFVTARYYRRHQQVPEKLAEAAGCYWHLVDLLWIGIFSIAYLL